MPDKITLQKWLEEAEAALQAVTIARREGSVGYDGKSVTYNPASEAKLRARIAELKAQLTGAPARSRSIGVMF